MIGIGKIKQKLRGMVGDLGLEVGIDLGSSNVLILVKDKGVVVDEPTMIVRQKKKRWTGLGAPKSRNLAPIAYGQKAKDMVNREPRHLEVVSPIKSGIISDLEAIEALLSYYLKLIYEIPSGFPKFFKPSLIVGVPSNITDVEKRAVRAVFLMAGAGKVMLVEEAVLAAVGLGLPVDSCLGLLVVDVGGGKIEATIVSMGGVVVGKGLKMGAGDWDTAIVNFVKMKYGLLIGPNTAERLKIELGNVDMEKGGESKSAVVRGRDLESGLPKSIKVSDAEIGEALVLGAAKVARLVKEVVDEAPPELMDDILRRGIVMIGRGAQLRGLGRLIESETKISTRLADDPGYCIVKGCGILFDDRKILSKVKLVMGAS